MGYQFEAACAFFFVLISIIWYSSKEKDMQEKIDNEREDMTRLFEKIEEKEHEKSILTEENNHLKKLVKDNMTFFSEKIEEKENEIRNLTEENNDLRKLASEQSKELTDFFDRKRRLNDAEKLISDENKFQLSEADCQRIIKKLKLWLKFQSDRF